MTLLLLTGCSPGSRSQDGEALALTIRGEYLSMTDCTAKATVTADYGQRVYSYQMDVALADGETTLAITAPDTVAGITAKLTGKDSRLEYDGLSVETGALNPDGLTPVSAVPALLEAARSGYITACSIQDNLLRVDCADPEQKAGTGTEITLWFDPQSHDLAGGEIFSEGHRVILLEFSEFTREKREST